MATISTVGNNLGFITANTCITYDIRSDKGPQHLKCDKPKHEETKLKEKQQGSEKGLQDNPTIEENQLKEGPQGSEKGPEKPQGSEKGPKLKEKPQGNEVGEERILAFGISPGGQYMVACDDYKQIWVWVRKDGEQPTEWTLHSKRDLGRRCTSVAFPKSEQNVLVADKSGDVFSFSLVDKQADGKLLLGHVSMLLDVILCGRDDNFVVTCDRDEKIRVSHYPNAYNIQSYCLGHTEFVSCLCYFEEDDLLVSAGGDCSIKIWNYKEGKVLHDLDLNSDDDIITEVTNELEAGDQVTGTEDKDGVMSRRQGVADVKCLACCQKNKFLVIGFDKQKCILPYKLDTSTSGKPVFIKRQKIPLSDGSKLWDLSFDQWYNLWYLESSPGNMVHILKYDFATDLYVQIDCLFPLVQSKQLLSVANDINSCQQELFKISFDQQQKNVFDLLHKVRIDNITDYMERKQTRIDEKAQKRQKKKEDVDEEPEDKVAKI